MIVPPYLRFDPFRVGVRAAIRYRDDVRDMQLVELKPQIRVLYLHAVPRFAAAVKPPRREAVGLDGVPDKGIRYMQRDPARLL